jgi:hypothetical protein
MASDSVKVLVDSGADLARGMNESGKFSGQIEAAAILRQGQSPSMASAAIGIGLWNVLKPRAKRDLPRLFVLALVGSEAVAFKARSMTVNDEDYYVTVWNDALETWPRSVVKIERTKKGIDTNLAIHVGGETILCSSQADETLDALEAALGGGGPAA